MSFSRSSIIKKAEALAEKSIAGVSDAIYATGSVVGKGGSKVTSFLTGSAEVVGGGIYNQCCNLVGAATSTLRVQEALESKGNVADIMDAEEQEDQKIRMSARDALDKVSGEGKTMIGMKTTKELDHFDVMLPLDLSSDTWKEAEAVTRITETMYPFENDRKRPSVKELDHVYKVALGVLLNPVNEDYQKELEPYVIQMFGKTKEEHNATRTTVALDQKPTVFKLNLKLDRGKDMVSRDANGKSDPYCLITVVKSEHVDMISSDKHDVVKINETKQLGLKIEKSHVIPMTLNPTWNQEFELPLRKDYKSDVILIEVWDSDETAVKLKDISFSNFGKFLRDFGDSDDFMGRAFLPLSAVGLTEQEKTLTVYSRNKKKTFGEVTIHVNLVGEKHTVDEDEVLKDHNLLTATVLDFESHMSGKYAIGWDVKITSLGYKLISLNACMNGITPLQQASILFPLLQLYDKHVNLSIIGYFGVVRTISLHQDQLPASPSGSRGKVEQAFGTYPEWVQTIFRCLENLDDTMIGVLRRHHGLFSFKTEEGIGYLALHIELIKEMYTIVPHVERLKDDRKSLKTTVQEACLRACMKWVETLIAEVTPLELDEKKIILCFVEVIDRIIQRLHNTIGQVQTIFQEIGIDYYAVFFAVVDQQVSAQVQNYTANFITTGGIPSYQLYLHLEDVMKLADHIPPKDRAQLHLKDYHDWFKGLVGDWIDVAARKCNDEIKRAVTSLDEVVTVTENVKFSQSALSAAACFKRIAAFWNNLHWPKVSEHYAFITRVVENVARAARFYIEESHQNLKKKGFHHSTGRKEFVATQELCISLNDIQYVREQLSEIPETLKFDKVISELSQVEGDQQAMIARKTLESLIKSADDDVKFLLNQVASSIGEQMSRDLTIHIKEIMETDHKVELVEAIDPLMQYLAKNLATFHASSLVSVLEIMLEEIWSVTIHCVAQVAKARIGQKNAKHLLDAVGELWSFFHAGGDGLPLNKMKSDEYKKTCETLDMQSSTDDDLIARHLKCLAKWSRSGDKSDGVLAFSVGYIQNKETLEITVIKGMNLPALDSNGYSDPFVDIVLMPERRFKIKSVKTDFKSKDLNPTYYKEFKIKVKENLLDMSGSVLTLTVYDHDYITRNEFAGIVTIDGAEIPRLPGGSFSIDDPNAPQRKTYELSLVPDTMTPALKELSERSHQYVNDFNLWYSKKSSVAGNVVSTVTGGFARVFSFKH
ncbi:BAI1-associated protein 3-like isoform X2 [Dysidea avara]|uniref:BAI1-associated protein 3-like isoform X2 n=1 Tax=Dysidea avara TaxID=196820 RepID=UPI00331E07F5